MRVGLAIGRDARYVAPDVGERVGVHARRDLALLQRQRGVVGLLGPAVAGGTEHQREGRRRRARTCVHDE
jgi:hypothetical protein